MISGSSVILSPGMLFSIALISSAVFGACSFRARSGSARGLVDVEINERDAVAFDERAGRLHEACLRARCATLSLAPASSCFTMVDLLGGSAPDARRSARWGGQRRPRDQDAQGHVAVRLCERAQR